MIMAIQEYMTMVKETRAMFWANPIGRSEIIACFIIGVVAIGFLLREYILKRNK